MTGGERWLNMGSPIDGVYTGVSITLRAVDLGRCFNKNMETEKIERAI